MKHNPIIIALDVESADQARGLVSRIGEAVDVYKVGMELYAASGPDYVSELIDDGKQVFLDLKFHDIGETVKRAVAQVARRGAHFLTVHATNQVMRAAVEGRGESDLKLLAVSVLTSVDQADLESDGISRAIPELVELRVRNAVAAGIEGMVCSPLEVARVRGIAGPDAVLVTPGVRSEGQSAGDQKRVATPAEAIARGASYIVVGREVTRATDPQGEVRRILSDVRGSFDRYKERQ